MGIGIDLEREEVTQESVGHRRRGAGSGDAPAPPCRAPPARWGLPIATTHVGLRAGSSLGMTAPRTATAELADRSTRAALPWRCGRRAVHVGRHSGGPPTSRVASRRSASLITRPTTKADCRSAERRRTRWCSSATMTMAIEGPGPAVTPTRTSSRLLSRRWFSSASGLLRSAPPSTAPAPTWSRERSKDGSVAGFRSCRPTAAVPGSPVVRRVSHGCGCYGKRTAPLRMITKIPRPRWVIVTRRSLRTVAAPGGHRRGRSSRPVRGAGPDAPLAANRGLVLCNWPAAWLVAAGG